METMMNLGKLLFSIIIPVYNVEEYLRECLDSLIEQTYKGFEIILVNDGSTDSSGIICDEYAEKYNNCLVSHTSNQGVSAARNLGIDRATGDYIMFVDSDDWLEREALQKIHEILIEYQYDILMYGLIKDSPARSRIILEQRTSERYLSNIEVAKKMPALIKNESINSAIKVYKGTMLRDNNFRFNTTIEIAEDHLFNIQCFFKAESLYILDEVLYHYMSRRDTSLSRKFTDNKYKSIIMVNNELLHLIKDDDNYYELYESLLYIRLKNIYSCFMDVFNPNCNYSFRRKLQFIDNILIEEKNTDFSVVNNKMFFILAMALKTNSKILIFLISKLIYILRKK
ncbi:glycosyltransferase family 2 protein [Paenibacillus sp. NPDC057934]|uniref:glycosyltransferase family 2 protein n=1 Tax=Paenibacillus sp. NPDC057934 TaxID=3346282 RepID=UPI0036DBA93A